MRAEPEPQTPSPANPPARELIDGLHARLGADGVKSLVAACLRSVGRSQAVSFMNSSLRTIRLPLDADRGRMGRLLFEGLERRSEPVLDVLQALARSPFESKANAEQRADLEKAIESLNRARQDSSQGAREALGKAAGEVVGILRDVIGAEEARRMVLVNAFPDTLEALLEAIAGGESP